MKHTPLSLVRAAVPARLKPSIKRALNKRLLSLAQLNSDTQSYTWHQLVKKDSDTLHEVDNNLKASFINFVLAQRSLSRSQIFQDLWVLWQTGIKTNGFFVEFGATNGVDLSNTHLLEKNFGWKGILAEPFPYWHSELAKNRSVAIDHRSVWSRSNIKMAFVGSDSAPEYAALELHSNDDSHSHRRNNESTTFDVNTVSLNDLLSDHKAPNLIDYLSVDTEGSEYEILESFDFQSFKVNLLTVEHNGHPIKRKEIYELLTRNGFERVFEELSLWDDWYVNKSFARPVR